MQDTAGGMLGEPTSDRFVIERRLGAGGMGVVYQALDRERNVRVALKTLKAIDAQSLYRLKTEFRSLQDISHRNLVTLGELVEERGRWFFTMELIEGVDFMCHVTGRESDSEVTASADTLQGMRLPQRVGTDSSAAPYDEGKLRGALSQLVEGVAALHAAGKIHRDIKPSNVLVTEEQRVVLLDFGLITDTDTARQSMDQRTAGTVEYMAPEQAASKPVGPPADWYAVGVMLYEVLTGRLPFTGAMLEVMTDKQRYEPPPPRRFVPALPKDLDSLCVDLLRFEPTARPDGREILKRVGASSPPPASPRGSLSSQFTQSSPFVGRAVELERLRDAYERTRSGSAVTVTVTGESGFGKSALVKHFTDQVQGEERQLIVLRGRCYERESLPYKALDGVVDDLTRYLRSIDEREANRLLPRNAALLPRLFPVFGRVEAIAQAPPPRRAIADVHELRRRVFEALRELLHLLAERNPLVIVIDDMQWADADSLLLLGDLIRPPDPPPLLVAITSRARVDVPGEVEHLRLEALEASAAEMLAHSLLQHHRTLDLDAADVAREAGGHPLFIAEMVRYAATQENTGRRVVRLDEAIEARAAQMSGPARLVLELVVIAGAPLEQDIIAQAAKLTPDEFARTVSLLRVANLVRIGGARARDLIEPYHHRVREALLARMDAQTRRTRHARLAIALESAGGRPEVLLRHMEGADQPARAARYAREAAERASDAFAFDQAAELYRTAMRLGEPDQDARRELLLALGQALINAGRGAEAATVLIDAADGADPAVRLECQRLAAEQLLVSGHIDRGMEVLGALLDEARIEFPKTPQRALASLLWQRLALRLRGLRYVKKHESEIARAELMRVDVHKAVSHGLALVDTIRGADFQARALRLALRTGEIERIARSFAIEASYQGSQGKRGHARARSLDARLKQIAAEEGSPYILGWSLVSEGVLSYFEGSFGHAAEVLARAAATFRDETTGSSWEVDNARLFRLFSLRHHGIWAGLRPEVDDFVRESYRRGDRFAETTARRYSSFLWLAEGDLAAARENLENAMWSPPEGRFHLQHWFELEARAEVSLYAGTIDGDFAELAPQFENLRASLLSRIQTVRDVSQWLLGRLLLACPATHDAARRRVPRLARALRRKGLPYATAWADLLEAGLAHRDGREDRAVAHLDRAIRVAGEHEVHLVHAAACRRRGEIVGGDEGAAAIADADRFMQEQTIVAPERFLHVLAPGFD